MEEYKNWLEKQIDKMNELVTNSITAKFYGAADTYATRASVYKECLCMFNKATEDKGISFSDLEVCKKYVSVFEVGEPSSVFIVLNKGCDDRGNYIVYYIVGNDSVSRRTYEDEFSAAKYFKEVQ